MGRQPSGERQLAPVTVAAAPGRRLGAALCRGPLADRLRRWLADGHGRSAGLAASRLPRPGVHGRAIRRTPPSAYREAIL